MNKFYTAALALILGFAASFVLAEEVVTVSTPVGSASVTVSASNATENAIVEAGDHAEAKVREASEKARARAADAARRASLTFTEARGEDAAWIYGGVKMGVCYAGSGVANADGYVAAAVAIPAEYVANGAFSAGAICASAAQAK
jgi:flagellar capping protein FliD